MSFWPGLLKVRDRLESYKDPGWYENPAGTLVSSAADEDLRRDAIDIAGPLRGEDDDTVSRKAGGCVGHP